MSCTWERKNCMHNYINQGGIWVIFGLDYSTLFSIGRLRIPMLSPLDSNRRFPHLTAWAEDAVIAWANRDELSFWQCSFSRCVATVVPHSDRWMLLMERWGLSVLRSMLGRIARSLAESVSCLPDTHVLCLHQMFTFICLNVPQACVFENSTGIFRGKNEVVKTVNQFWAKMGLILLHIYGYDVHILQCHFTYRRRSHEPTNQSKWSICIMRAGGTDSSVRVTVNDIFA